MASHPFKFYLDFGIRVTINTDNRLITDTTVTKELLVTARQFGLTAKDIRNVLVGGFKSAFLTFHDRAQLVRKVQNEMEEVIARFAANDPATPENGALPQRKQPPASKPPASKPPNTKRA
jgi:adenosine deaminase